LQNKLLDRVAQSLNVERPEADSMDGYLKQILPVVRPLGEDLWEEEVYIGKPWLEVRDDVHFHKAILHFFHEGGEYLRSVDGNVSGGSWRILEPSNKMLIEHGGGAELFDLAFLDQQFFILDKHGDQERLGQRRFTVFLIEPLGKKLVWRDAMELLFQKYHTNNTFFRNLSLIILVIITIILALSVL